MRNVIREQTNCIIGEVEDADSALKAIADEADKPKLVVVELHSVDAGSEDFYLGNKLFLFSVLSFIIGPLLCHLIRKAYPDIKIVTYGDRKVDWNRELKEHLAADITDTPWDVYLGPYAEFDRFLRAVEYL